MPTAESKFSNFVIEYLGEIETKFENILVCLSGAQMGLKHGKKERSKISWHTSFKASISICDESAVGAFAAVAVDVVGVVNCCCLFICLGAVPAVFAFAGCASVKKF